MISPPGTAGPVEQGGAALRGEHDSGRELMGGCDDDGPHVAGEVRPHAVVVNGDRPDRQARRARHLACPVPARVLNGYRLAARAAQRPAHAADPVGCAGADGQVPWIRLRASGPRQVLREHPAKRLVSCRIGVSEVGYGQGGGGRPDRGRPAGGRKCSQVRQTRRHVDPPGRAYAGRRLFPAPGRSAAWHTDTSTRARPCLHVARGGELRVRLCYHPARAPEVCRQDAARRQQAAGGEPRTADCLTQCAGQPFVQRPGIVRPEAERNAGVEIGLVITHLSGS